MLGGPDLGDGFRNQNLSEGFNARDPFFVILRNSLQLLNNHADFWRQRFRPYVALYLLSAQFLCG
jgi:hypothetical protein